MHDLRERWVVPGAQVEARFVEALHAVSPAHWAIGAPRSGHHHDQPLTSSHGAGIATAPRSAAGVTTCPRPPFVGDRSGER
jgi:hypothetical protein